MMEFAGNLLAQNGQPIWLSSERSAKIATVTARTRKLHT